MRSYKYFLMAAAAMAFAACSNDNDNEFVNEPTPIRLSSSLTVTGTRAGTDLQTSAFDESETVDVFISENVAAGTTAKTTYPQPLTYTTGANGSLTIATQPYFPAGGNGVNIHAIYPSGKVTAFDDTAVNFIVATDQSTDANYKASDLMYGAPASNPVARTSNAVVLTFKHLLSKVTVTLIAGDGNPSLNGAKVELLDVLPEVEFKPSTQALGTAKGTATDITVMTTTATLLSGSAIIVPQTLAQQFVRVTLADGCVLLGKLDDNTAPALTGGNEYKYDITVNVATLSITSTIVAWNDGGTSTGTAEME